MSALESHSKEKKKKQLIRPVNPTFSSIFKFISRANRYYDEMFRVLITGCSDGSIGSALVVEFPKHGLHVLATAPNPSEVSGLKGLFNVTLLPLDVRKSYGIKVAIEVIAKKTGDTLNYLISNVGRHYFKPLLDQGQRYGGARHFDIRICQYPIYAGGHTPFQPPSSPCAFGIYH
ncbi:hypothetical protein GGR53DRAFT_493815 [Hypoxylon sp. FL1150]|nr:hypothetical protein GGR53DRAFT_493815 [Hypoxylon sp. FL1150]